MQLALAQIVCEPGNVPANIGKIKSYVSRAAGAGCGAVLFPELSDTGYAMPAVRECASSWPGGAYDAVAGAAAECGCTVVCGLSERTGGGIYNSLAMFGPDGVLLGRYRKSHLFAPAGEADVFLAGDEVVCVETGGTVWGLSVCFDLRFPELYRTLALGGATVLVNCAAWPAVRKEHWNLLSAARAVENQAFFIGVNRAGTDAGVTMAGNSRVIASDGRIIARAGADEELLIAEIDPADTAAARSALPVRDHRLPDAHEGVPGRRSGAGAILLPVSPPSRV